MLDWIFEGMVTWVSSIVSQILDAVSGIFLDVLGTDMTAMEEYFPFAEKAYTIMQYTSWAVLFLITVWQLFRVFGGPLSEAENPWTLIARSCLFAFLIYYAKTIFTIVLNIATAPYTALMEVKMDAEDFTFSGLEGALKTGVEVYTSTVTVVGLLLMIILMVSIGWNYFKMLLETVERYVVVGVLCYTSPLAFSMGGSKTTLSVFQSWCRMVGSQLLLLVLNVWFLRGFSSSVGEFIGNGGTLTSGDGGVFLWFFCALAFLKTAQKFDSYLAAMGLNVAQTGSSMGMELLLATRAISGLGGGVRSAANVFSSGAVAGVGATGGAGTVSSGFASRFKGNSYVRDAVVEGGMRMGAGGGMGVIGRAFGGIAARNGATLTGESIASVAGRNPKFAGEIAGDIADRSLGNYMPQLGGVPLKDTHIEGGKISTTAMGADGKMAELNMYKADQFSKPDGALSVQASDGSTWYQTASGAGAGSFLGMQGIADGSFLANMFPDFASETAFRAVDEGIIEATTDNGSSMWYSSAFFEEPNAPHENIQASDGVDWYAMQQHAQIPAFETDSGSDDYNMAQFQSFMPGYEGSVSAIDAGKRGEGQFEVRNEDGSGTRFFDVTQYRPPKGDYTVCEDSRGGSWYAVAGEASVERKPVYKNGKPVYDGDDVKTYTVESVRYRSTPEKYADPQRRDLTSANEPRRKR